MTLRRGFDQSWREDVGCGRRITTGGSTRETIDCLQQGQMFYSRVNHRSLGARRCRRSTVRVSIIKGSAVEPANCDACRMGEPVEAGE
jgi:hypothetical protein